MYCKIERGSSSLPLAFRETPDHADFPTATHFGRTASGKTILCPRRESCTVSVKLEPDQDPERHGQHLLGLHDDPMTTKGFPVIQATVSSPLSRTYASLYGWVQITNTPGEDWVTDLYPLFQDLNNPYSFWGAQPTLVDAPSRPPSLEHYDWKARSFLCHGPDAAMTKHVVPLLAFEWGFWIEDYKPYVKRLLELPVASWNEHLELFRSKFSGWTFDRVEH